MSKTVLKLRPADYWRIGEHESWFTDMAAQGLHLKKTGAQFARFEKGEPKKTRYRIEVTEDKLTEEQKTLYREYGWEFVTKFGKFNVFSSPEDLAASELHTDAAEQSYTLKALDESYRASAIMIFVAVIVIIAMTLLTFFITNTTFLYLAEGYFLNEWFIVLINLYNLFNSWQASRSISILRKSLQEGKPINHHARWQKNQLFRHIVAGVFLIMASATVTLPIMTMTKSTDYTMPVGTINIPIIRLTELENNSDLVREPFYRNDEVDWGNRVSYDWSPLAPIQYDTNERGIVRGVMWKDGSGQYSPMISTQYYELTFTGMIDGVIKDLIKRSYFRDDENPRLIINDNFDRLYVMEVNETKYVFASRGNKVISIRYHGYADIEQIIDLAAAKLLMEWK